VYAFTVQNSQISSRYWAAIQLWPSSEGRELRPNHASESTDVYRRLAFLEQACKGIRSKRVWYPEDPQTLDRMVSEAYALRHDQCLFPLVLRSLPARKEIEENSAKFRKTLHMLGRLKICVQHVLYVYYSHALFQENHDLEGGSIVASSERLQDNAAW